MYIYMDVNSTIGAVKRDRSLIEYPHPWVGYIPASGIDFSEWGIEKLLHLMKFHCSQTKKNMSGSDDVH